MPSTLPRYLRFQLDTADALSFTYQTGRLCLFEHANSNVAGALEQPVIHFSAAEAEGRVVVVKPAAGHIDAAPTASIKDGLRQRVATGGQHPVGNSQPFEMFQALWRDELAAELCAREFLLLDKQNSCSACSEMNRGAGPCRAGAGDNYVVSV